MQIPGLSLPKGGGSIKGIGESFSPNLFSGTASFSIPVPATPARGLEPGLSLDYHSGGGNGPFGLGFSLPLPAISIDSNHSIPTYTGEDRYSIGNTRLVPKSGSAAGNVITWLPVLEEDFTLIEQHTDPQTGTSWWKTVSSANITSFYGDTEGSRVYDPQDPAHIYTWMITRTEDSHGNKITYGYKKEQTRIYIRNIQYGNYFDETQTEKWAFELVFDYGEYELPSPGHAHPIHQPVRSWATRKDPFSTYRSGFEIRTQRLCHNILLFHHFPNELGEEPCLVKALRLTYDDTPTFSFLTDILLTGFTRKEDGSYEQRSTPPSHFSYTPFQPALTGPFKELQIKDNGLIPGYTGKGEYQPVDLYSEGIPGILYSNDSATLYWKPEGEGRLGFAQSPIYFPIEKDLADPSYTLNDLDGDGKIELMVASPQRSGYYAATTHDNWAPFVPFDQSPDIIGDPQAEWADLNGNGHSDLFMVNGSTINAWFSGGRKGFGKPVTRNKTPGFPSGANEDPRRLVTFADMFGDGLSHRVRVSDGKVEVWPNIGHGRFGNSLLLGNAPRFDDDMDSSRIHLADLDGSGTQDLVLVYPDRIDIHINQSGNAFSNPISLILPEKYSPIDQLSFADLLGTGTTCILFTKIEPSVKHYYYEFSNRSDNKYIDGVKSYLLYETDNNLGGKTKVKYGSSTHFYLRDKKRGRPWVTRLPFPVQVIEKTETIDLIAGTNLTTQYIYHDGYFDPVEKEFRGFGSIEHLDSESFEQSATNAPKELYVPPVLTKTWYHTGCFEEAPALLAQYRKDYFRGDPLAASLPETFFHPPIPAGDAATIRQAYAALSGKQLRQEIYGLDKSNCQDIPYGVTESVYEVRRYQPKAGRHTAVFTVCDRESIQYHYERNAADPRVQHAFVLERDAFNNVLRTCTISYPRRPPVTGTVYPEQTRLEGTCELNDVINHTEGFRLIGVAFQGKTFELSGLDLKNNRYFTFEEIKTQVAKALQDIVPYQGQRTKTTLQARQFAWNRSLFWNETQDQALAPGAISSKGLLHHEEKAVFPKEYVEKIFEDRLTDQVLEQQGGYFFDPASQYWWNKGLVQYYYTPAQKKGFYLPHTTENSFVPPASSLFFKAATEYNQPYFLTAIKNTVYIDEQDGISNEETISLDYSTLQPKQLIDINKNVSQLIFDPLGQVIASSAFSIKEGQLTGGMLLLPYGGLAAEYTRRSGSREGGPITFNDVLKDPSWYLQGAATFFYNDPQAWSQNKQPASAITLVRDNYYHSPERNASPLCHTSVAYSDGMGRNIETRIHTGPADRWQVSGKTVYNNKGAVTESWLPFFSNTPFFGSASERAADPPAIPPTVTHYDPLLRVVRTDSPKHFFSKVEFTPWEIQRYDEDDTILDAPYYKYFMEHYPLNPSQQQIDERDALEKAARFYNTPAIDVLGNTGHTFLSIENNLGAVSADSLKKIAEGSVISPTQIWNHLVIKGYLTLAGWLTPLFQPYQPGFRLDMDQAFDPLLDKINDLLLQGSLTSYYEQDILGRELLSIDPRLYYSNITKGTDYYNFKYTYEMGTDAPLSIDSADAGKGYQLSDIFDNPFWSWSPRSVNQLISFDRLQRRTEVLVLKIDDRRDRPPFSEFLLAEQYTYGETQPGAEQRNLRGQLYQLKDQSGICTNPRYALNGEVLETSRRFTTDYRQMINWREGSGIPLETTAYTTRFAYDARGRLLEEALPDRSTILNTYDQTGLPATISARLPDGALQPVIDQIVYDANGQRTLVAYGNGLRTTYTYEETTLRLTALKTTRSTKDAKGNPRDPLLQNIQYTYDPVGNITRMRDSSRDTVFHDNQKVEPLSEYTYDALYRLLRADGRQHPGINIGTYKNNKKDNDFKQSKFSPLPSDIDKLEKYTEYYTYDMGGNLIRTQHVAASSPWTRDTTVTAHSNHLQDLPYDESGNQRQLMLDNSVTLSYDLFDGLSGAGIIERDEQDDADFYTYDINRLRTRKISERMRFGGALTQTEEKKYLGDYEEKTRRSISVNGMTTSEQRSSIRIMDEGDCVLLIHYTPTPGSLQRRWQLDNLLGSVSMEVDNDAQLISYEEYFPYGGTAIIAGANEKEVDPKDYRYCGKECDDNTGLYYYGARYYAPWLGRWLDPDPAGTIDGFNLYAFVGGNPVTYTDPTGMVKGGKKKKAPKKKAKAKTVTLKTDDIPVHGQFIPKPEKIQELHKGSLAVGQQIRADINSGNWTLAKLEQLDKDIVKLKGAANIPLQEEATFDNAVELGLAGDNKKAFSDAWRATDDHMDEHVSTITMFHVLAGIGSGLSASKKGLVKAAARIVSHFRMPTSMTGYNKTSGSVQHPTTKGWEYFAHSGHAHGYWDRMRREDVVKEGQTTKSKGVDRLIDMAVEAARHSLSWGLAPATASNSPALATPAESMAQAEHREIIKKMAHLIIPDPDAGKTQSINAPWLANRTRRFSLARA
ncbi:MAG TPA: SpvB/TcaC N-terminal domain-containing protein [Puia sp.]|jgi:RHS repeat-associated protein